ncbi:MAG: TonB-dependent receptor [Flavobacteriales bacterium]
MARYILVLFACFLGGSVWGQMIHGNVYEQLPDGTLQGIPFVKVYWKGTFQGAEADENGHFHLKPSPNDTLMINHLGYLPYEQVYRGEEDLEIILQPSKQLDAVEIEQETGATKINLRDAQLSQTMTEKELCKAACCNLSESFETNASIDASFTDAITGTRQIKMLGLDGKYTQILFDNIPTVRGLASIYGLTYVPGPWVREIAISKGIGSVVSGFESITGQINVGHKGPEMKERAFINAYGGSQGRYEFNGVWNAEINHHWHNTFALHGAMAQQRFDMNKDGFLDNPLFKNLALRNEWSYVGHHGLRGNYTLSYHHLENVSGKLDYDPKDEIRAQLWGVNMTTDRYDFVGKTGYVWEEKDYQSIGSQVSLNYHDQRGNYGYRSYSGQQTTARANIMFASRYSESLKYTAGVSFNMDDYTERLDSLNFDRTEQTFGAYIEHTYNLEERLSVIVGLRGDIHNTYGFFFTPRLHARYSFTDQSSIKLAAGKGYRSPNLLMDHVGMFASNRDIQITSSDAGAPFGMKMEEAWNFGLAFMQRFKLNHREASIAIDVYHTRFEEQIVADWETPTVIKFYQLDGQSYSNSVQVEMQWSPVKRLEWRLAYRWLDAKTTYGNELLTRPLIAQHRFFTNIAYSTKEKDNEAKWMFDITAKWLDQQRLPLTATNPEGLQLGENSSAYWLFNAQISRHFNDRFEVYVGGENLANFFQKTPIISAEDPSSSYFDASLIWGPVFGRMGYVGLRWRIGEHDHEH